MQALKLAALSVIVLYASFAAGPPLRDLNGRQLSPISEGTVVLVFTRTDCPISNRYAPELARLYRQFHSSGVQFRLVYVDGKQSADDARAHLREFGYPFQGVFDRGHELVKLTGVKTTPQAAVYLAGRMVYRGRIDNQYVSAGKSRPAATVHDLEDTLKNIDAGKSPAFRSEPAVGCFIEDVR